MGHRDPRLSFTTLWLLVGLIVILLAPASAAPASFVKKKKQKVYFWNQLQPENFGSAFQGRGEHTSSLVDQKIFLIGGCAPQDRCFSDVFGLNLASLSWFDTVLLHNPPTARKEHTATVVGMDIWVIGGFAPPSLKFLNETLIYHTGSLNWEVPQIGGIPVLARAGHSATLVGANKIFVIGGYSDEEFFEALIVLNTELRVWTQPSLKGVGLTPRKGHSANLVGTLIYIYGGYTRNARTLSDLFILDTVSMVLFRPSTSAQDSSVTPLQPPAVTGHSMVSINSTLYLFGGCQYGDGKSMCNNKLFLLELDSLEWSLAPCQGMVPSPRAGHTATLVGSRMYIISGCMMESDCYANVFYIDLDPCRDMCSGNGLCRGGHCDCYAGYSGDSCGDVVISCHNNCSNHGVCKNAHCECWGGYVGDYCDDPAPNLQDMSHLPKAQQQQAIEKSKNIGSVGRSDIMEYRDLDVTEEEDTVSDRTRTTDGLARCLNNCTSNGVCKNGVCSCFFGWTGASCDTARYFALCPHNCSKNGHCYYGRCYCYSGFGGADCATNYSEGGLQLFGSAPTVRYCPDDCGGHGQCGVRACNCYPGWYGDACEKIAYPLCPQNCVDEDHGVCVRGKCECTSYYHGPACNETNEYRYGQRVNTALVSMGLNSTNGSSSRSPVASTNGSSARSTVAGTNGSSARSTVASRAERSPPLRGAFIRRNYTVPVVRSMKDVHAAAQNVSNSVRTAAAGNSSDIESYMQEAIAAVHANLFAAGCLLVAIVCAFLLMRFVPNADRPDKDGDHLPREPQPAWFWDG
eukprot:gnl/Spiro4/27597_TR13730_c0_g1_i3.p1 gnl/Spiro4/27597_TR13730_c0_g1~~gnl/Spiro4/27597_TR13730_c0_g1_i3.p1  ORF type:complete len:799 (-),score=233.97 gnl/Spiro4/27597_TR13730_c0_g1_i3:111-2507(-)